MYKMKESGELLNRHALTVRSGGLSFVVHYWGISLEHFDNPVHKHSFFEICYVWGGRGEYVDDGATFELRPGAMFCSRPGVVHQIRSREGLALLFVAFEVDEGRSDPAEAEKYRTLAEDAEPILYGTEASHAANLWRSLLLPAAERQRASDELLADAAGLLLRSFADLFSPRRVERRLPSRSAEHLLRRAKLFVRDNLDRPITLAQVAEYLHVSERHVSRIFAEGIHESFNVFVRRERIRQAAYLLRHTDDAVKDIAERTGFATVHSFTRAFARELGVPPARYRSGERR